MMLIFSFGLMMLCIVFLMLVSNFLVGVLVLFICNFFEGFVGLGQCIFECYLFEQCVFYLGWVFGYFGECDFIV